MRMHLCLMTLTLVALVAPAQAAPCTPQQRVDYAKSGYGPADIDRMCGGANTSSGNAMDLFAKAYNAKQARDLRTSQQLFEQGLSMDPGNADARKFLFEVKEALSQAQKLFESAYNAKQSNDLKTAKQLFEQGLAIEPRNPMGQKFLAEVNAALAAAPPPVQPGPKEFCADRPNFISRGICEKRECDKPINAKDPYCEPYKRN